MDRNMHMRGFDLNSGITAEDLHREKVEQDRIYQERLDALLKEKQDQISFYQQKIDQIEREQLHEKGVTSKVDELLEEKALQDKLYNQRVEQLRIEKEEQDKLFNEKLNILRQQEMGKNNEKQLEIERLREDKEIRTRTLQDKIEALKLEKERHETFFEDKIKYLQSNDSYLHNFDEERHKVLEEKALQDKLFEDKLNQLEHEKLLLDEQFNSQLHQLELRQHSINERDEDNAERFREAKAIQTEQLDHKIDQLQEDKLTHDSILDVQESELRQHELREQQMAEREYQMQQRQNISSVQDETNTKQGVVGENVIQEGAIAAGSGKQNRSATSSGQLCRLRDMKDFEVADDDPDIRGWQVYDRNNELVGVVDELIVDPKAMKVRYLEVEIASHLTHGEERRHLLLPIGAARLDQDKVLVNNIDRHLLSKYPAYDGGEVTREHEHSIRNTLSPGYSTGTDKGDFYAHEHYNSEGFFRSRRSGDDTDQGATFI